MMRVLVATVVSLIALPSAPVVAHAAPDGWSSDLEAARRETKKSGRPIWVVVRCER